MTNTFRWKFLDYFFSLRPILMIPGWSTLLAGYFIADATGFTNFNLAVFFMPGPELVLLLISFGAAMGGCFLLNQIKDKKSDSFNNKLFLISKGYVTVIEAYALTVIMFLSALSIAYTIGYQVFIVVSAFIILTGYVYNYPPFKAKDRPVASLITNSLMGGLAFSAGWLANQTAAWSLVVDMAPYLAFNTALYFFTLLPDREGDKLTTKNTMAVLLSIKSLVITAFIVYGLGFIFAIYSYDMRAIMIFCFTLPFFIFLLIKMDQASAVRTTKFGIFFFAMIICLHAPWYLIMLIGIFLLTKWYFKKRFNFNYPNFNG